MMVSSGYSIPKQLPGSNGRSFICTLKSKGLRIELWVLYTEKLCSRMKLYNPLQPFAFNPM